MSHESLPIHRMPDTPEFKAAVAQHDKMMRESEERNQKQKELGNVHIFSPEEGAKIRAEAEAKLEEQRRIIRETKN